MQYFERARFERRPARAGAPHEILLGLLGYEAYRTMNPAALRFPTVDADYFSDGGALAELLHRRDRDHPRGRAPSDHRQGSNVDTRTSFVDNHVAPAGVPGASGARPLDDMRPAADAVPNEAGGSSDCLSCRNQHQPPAT